jgi:host factor-I protein
MPAKVINLQDSFLNQVRKENISVSIHLVNGFQLKGNVRGFDSFTIILDVMGRQQLVYKHAISTITPAKPISGTIETAKQEDRA